MDKAKVLRMIERRMNGSTQHALAQAIGVSDAYLSDVRRGKRNPGPKIIKGLGLSERKIYSRTP